MNTRLPIELAQISEGEGDDAQSCSSAPTKGEAEQAPSNHKIATRETRVVSWLRLGLAAVLMIATVLVSLAIFYFTRGLEEEDFEAAFADSSTKVLEAFAGVAERRLGSIASFATSITAHTLAINATWPFVTIPHIEAQADNVIRLADAVHVSFTVVVEAADRPKWETEFFPNTVNLWHEESKEYAAFNNKDDNDGGGPGGPPYDDREYEGKPGTTVGGFRQEIFYLGTTPLGTLGPIVSPVDEERHLVWWQAAPYIPGWAQFWMNFDLKRDPGFMPRGSLLNVLEKKLAALGPMSTSTYGAQGNDPPVSSFYYPVQTGYDAEASLGGALVTLLNWDSFFANILPQNINGLTVVLRNSCDQAYTFIINGPSAVYLGEGDLHDPNYEHMMDEVSFTSLINQAAAEGTYRGSLLDEDGCQYSLQVYASQDMEDAYISFLPIYYTIGAAFIFIFTSLVFVIYDRLVEYRQRLTLKEAQKSGAIVASLFPEAYKNKLMEEQERQLQEAKAGTKGASTHPPLASALNGMDDEDYVATSEQLAELYPDCTIFFADIAGFTNWSSTRTPNEVFTLLQTLFGRFDRIAQRRKVFKIETIGDCYLAVTGLPHAQENHALIMAKFANECLVKMNETTCHLVDELGEDTADLVLRIGLNSGPITAGVLRGTKSRFQVFGDTVNVGSRMESTGEGNRVQVSATTAKLLQHKHGKGHWLQPREDLVHAKGKGAMETYWLVPERSASNASTAATTFSSSASRAYPAELSNPDL